MDVSVFFRRPVVTSVLIVAATMIVIGSGWAAAVVVFNLDPPNSSGAVTTVISILAGTSWFRRYVGRPMLHRERLAFATGVTLLNAAVPVGLLGALIMWLGLPLSIASFDLVLGGKGLLEPAFAWLMVFVLAAVFAGAYFAAGRSARKTTRDKATL